MNTIAPNRQFKRRVLLISASLLLPISFLMALAFGTITIGAFSDTLTSLLGVVSNKDLLSRADLVIQEIRLQRALLSAIVGALLGICGATTQGLFRNPLAGSDGWRVGWCCFNYLCASSLSAITSANLLGLSGLGLVSVGAFAGGAIAVIIVYSSLQR